MEFNNKDGFLSQGTPQQKPFEQQEFSQQQINHFNNQHNFSGQPAEPFINQQNFLGQQLDPFRQQGFNAQHDVFGSQQSNLFGVNQSDSFNIQQDFTQTVGTFDGQYESPQGWGTAQTPEGWDIPSQAANGGEQIQNNTRKSTAIIGIAGAALVLLAIILFMVFYRIEGTTDDTPNNGDITLSLTDEQQYESQPRNTDQTEQEYQVPQQTTQTSDSNGWRIISDTDGFTFIETREALFIVAGVNLYFKPSESGIQVRHTAYGAVQGFGGVYEVDIPRSAALIDEVVPGFTFTVFFDIYRSADGQTSFLENLRPN